MNDKKPSVRKMPKGGRKGGAIFPRITLDQALTYARKLVSKSHASAQKRDIVLAGVVGSSSSVGNARMSALKQFGLMEGDNKLGYTATELAKKIAASPDEEEQKLLAVAALRPVVFRSIFETFRGDSVSVAKIKQRAGALNVHPDETDNCAQNYIETLKRAGVVTIVDDQVSHVEGPMSRAGEVDRESDGGTEPEPAEAVDGIASEDSPERSSGNETEFVDRNVKSGAQSSREGRAQPVFHVNITLDASMDAEKLQKHLELLRKYGAI